MAGIQSDLWAVKGGNKRVPERLVHHAKVNFIPAEVKTIELLENEDALYEIYYVPSNLNTKEKEVKTKRYDMVVIATPLHDGMSKIKFEGFAKEIVNFPQKYHQTVATFVTGTPNASAFGLAPTDTVPTGVLTNNPFLFINSYGKHEPVDFDGDTSKPVQYVGKLFSNKPPSKEEVEKYFSTVEDIRIVPWLAYPEYNFKTDDLPPFLLNDRMYYVNAIELAASAMEMSALSGKNIALLAHHHWTDNFDKIDEPFPFPEGYFEGRSTEEL